MINTSYFSVSTAKKPSEQEKGRLDMLDSASDEAIEIDLEGGAENASLIDKTKTQAKSISSNLGKKMENVQEKMQTAVEAKTGDLTKPNYLWMTIFFGVSCLFGLAAFTALPFILFSPASFNMYFSLCTSSLLVAVSFYYGPLTYFKSLFERQNLMITLLYIASNLACLSTIFLGASYFTSIGLLVLQSIAVAFFILRVFAGGENA